MHRLLSYYFPLVIVQLVDAAAAKSSTNIFMEKKPNVLLILADDVGTGEVPGYWNTGLVSMPNLQEHLVQQGTVFTDAHSTRKYKYHEKREKN